MSYLIWYDNKNGNYSHGTDIDLEVNRSLSGENFEILYELEEEEKYLVKKIVSQLNSARAASNRSQIVLK